ncbi:MAG: hypothetical protein K9G36_08005 [Crocinitomicaceae bacterium]|jgi:hypothetical protein|nr:hypothetical protein [Crocinitomicaceae bacterium]
MKKAYYYLFYKLYKWIGEDNWWTEWKALLFISALVFYTVFSLLVYYTIFIDRYFQLGDNKLVVFFFILSIPVPNYFIFNHSDQWKDIVKEFDKLPKRKNKIGGWIVFGVVLLIIANLFFAFYHMSLIDWTRYR